MSGQGRKVSGATRIWADYADRIGELEAEVAKLRRERNGAGDRLEWLRGFILDYKAERDADEWGDDEALLARQMHARQAMFIAAARTLNNTEPYSGQALQEQSDE